MSKNKNKQQAQVAEKPKHKHLMAFNKDNYRLMLIGLVIIVIGFILMVGKTDELFNNGEIFRGAEVSFSTTLKVTIAPIVVLAGFVVEVFAILKSTSPVNEPS
jgi:Protein of unknown function (DUF3098)